MRRQIALLLAVCFAALGTGGVQYLHNLQHLHGRGGEGIAASQPSHSKHRSPAHDESSCTLCLQLHQPIFVGSVAPLLSSSTLLVGVVSTELTSLDDSRHAWRIDCRGPPMRWL